MGNSDTDELRATIKDYLSRPGILSKGQISRISQGFASSDANLTSKEAAHILDDIRLMDAGLAAQLQQYTPHDSCQVSFIRDVLRRVWKRAQYDTHPIPVISEVADVRPILLGVMS